MFDEVNDHAESIKEAIISDLYCQCYVSYFDMIYSAEDIKKAYQYSKEFMVLGKKFRMKEHIFYYKHMLFEKLVHSIDLKVKEEMLKDFRQKLSILDYELIHTIEEFINCNLNISDASKQLYIHRNTLIYRLDKIYKDTGYDIRNFRDAMIFVIMLLIWKEDNIK